MSLYVIAELLKEGTEQGYYDSLGYRIFDNRTMKYIDVSKESIARQLKKGTRVQGLFIGISLDMMTGYKSKVSRTGWDCIINGKVTNIW